MKATLTLMLLGGILVSSSSARASSGDTQTRVLTPPAQIVPFTRKPFEKLFRPAPPPPLSRTSAQRPAGPLSPKVVCGMTLIPGDSTVDPGIATRTQA